MTAGHRRARAPVALLEMSATPSDGAVARTVPLNTAPDGVSNTVGFARENAFTPPPRKSRVLSSGPTTSGETDTLPAPGAVTTPVTSRLDTVASAATRAFSVTRFPMRMSSAAPSAVSARLTAATGLNSRLGFISTAVLAFCPSASPTCVTSPVAISEARSSSPNAYTKLPSAFTVTSTPSFPVCQSGVVASSPSYTRKCIVFV